MTSDRTRRASFLVAVVAAVALVGVVGVSPARRADAAPSAVSFNVDEGALVFQASTDSPINFIFPAEGTLDGSWDHATGGFTGTLGLGYPKVALDQYSDIWVGARSTDKYSGAPVAVSGNLPVNGDLGVLEADVWLLLSTDSPANIPWVNSVSVARYGPVRVSFSAAFDYETGALELQAAGFKGPAIDSCIGNGCQYTFKDVANAWGLPASLMMPYAQPTLWTNEGNSDSTFGLHLSGGPTFAFADVPSSHPFAGAISWMSDSGISTGYPDGTFRPAAPVARQALAAFLYRLSHQPTVTATEPIFEDMPSWHPFYPAIQWMAESGLSNGTPVPGGKPVFKPSDTVSRQAAAAFLYRFAHEPTVTATEPFFDDVSSSHPFYTAIQWMAESGLSNGTPVPGHKPVFKPVDAVSRQASAAFLYRFANLS